MELHSKDFGSKREYHNKRRELVSNGHVVAHSNGAMTRFHPEPRAMCIMDMMGGDCPCEDLGWKWVVIVRMSGYLEVYQVNKYQEEYNQCEQMFGTVEISSDKKTVTVHLNKPFFKK